MSGTYKHLRRDRQVAEEVAAIHERLAALARGPVDASVAEELGAIRAHLQTLADSNAEVAARLADVIGPA